MSALAVELRSVNHRYLDLQLRLPDELRGLESALRERIAAELKRGKVECRVALNRTDARCRRARRRPGARRAGRAPRRARSQQHAPGAAPLSITRSCAGPGVLAEPTVAPEELAARAHDLVGACAARARAQRAPAKGAKTRADARRRLRRDRGAGRARRAADSGGPRRLLEKLGARLREAGLDPDQERLKQELALFATKIDVAEEVSRLGTHVAEVRRVLAAGGSAGKRLDFLMQELHREANTLGSKSVDAELSQASLELKVLIEQMREQVQNIE